MITKRLHVILPKLCGSRYLSDGSMYWGAQLLNSIENNTHLRVYANWVSGIEFFDRISDNFEQTKLLLIFNVGLYKEGSTIIGSNTGPGCRFSIAIYDDMDKAIMYVLARLKTTSRSFGDNGQIHT